MISLGLAHVPREVRESYTDQVVSRLYAAATGVGDGSTLAVVEVASRWWGAGLASATVQPENLALRAVTPTFLDSVGRSLCRSGESLHVLDVRGGRLTLTPSASWSVHGGDDPDTWRYRITLAGPTETRTTTLGAASVLHIRYAPSPETPWQGRSPLQLAAASVKAATLLETATSEEMAFTQQQILSPRRNQGDYGMADLTPDLIAKIVSAFSAHTGSGAFVVPGDLEPRRLGPEPPASFAELRDRLETSLVAAFGIPPALLSQTTTGVAMRESFRQILHALIKPLGSLVAEELQAKLHPDAALSFDKLRASDISGTSRAFGSLVTAGLSPQAAAAIVGIGDDVEVSP